MHFFSKIVNGGHMSGALMVIGSADWPEKMGIMTAAHPHTHFLGQCPQTCLLTKSYF